MRIAFFIDGPISIDTNGRYYGVAFNDKMLSRYLDFADEIEVCVRVKPTDDPSGLSRISLPQITVTSCVNMSSAEAIVNRAEAVRIIKEVLGRCDAAIIRFPGRISQVAAKCCRDLQKPYMIEMVGCCWDALWNHSPKGKLVALPFTIETKMAVKKAPAVLYVTNEFLQRRYPTDGVQIGCSDVVLHEIDNQVLEKRIDKIHRWNGSKLIIGTTAAVNVKYKGQRYVIEALGNLKKKGNTKFEYQLAGNGDQTYLKEMAKKYGVEDQVKLLGGIPHEQVFDWLDSLDLYVQPSRQEGLPRALVEAMSRGLPALGAKTGGIPELLESDFIFSNSNRNIYEISRILTDYTTEKMEQQARKNFEKAKEYQKEKLENKRKCFYKDYFSSVN